MVAADAAAAPRALVVDDAAAEREHLAAILREAGWVVTLACDGAEALEQARDLHPAIIFLDILMPRMDGYQTCRRLAEDPATRSIPVVFVSTKSQRADQVWARMQGGRDLIPKPARAPQVLAALRHAVA